MINQGEIERFLGWYLGHISSGKASLWCAPSRSILFFSPEKDIPDAARWAAKKAETENVYFGVGILAGLPGTGRGTAADVRFIPGLWADVDFAGDPAEGHNRKPGVAKSLEDALLVVDSAGPTPSIVVHSGHGVQAYWLFQEPIEVREDKARERIQRLEIGWLNVLRRAGRTIDSVHDFARLMRLPGTVNRKGKPVAARILRPSSGAPRTYPVEDLESIVASAGVETHHSPQIPSHSTAMEREPAVPSMVIRQIEVMCQSDPKFRRTWERKRTDMSDQSASAYDLSIASQMVISGASDEEIRSALLAWRSKHGEDTKKILRNDYIARTISRARAVGSQSEALQRAFDAVAQAQSGETGIDRVREQVLAGISTALGIKIRRFVKHGRENSIYSLELADGTDVVIGSARKMLSQTDVRARIMDAANIAIRQIRSDQWLMLINSMLQVVEEISNEESTRRAQIIGWLREFLSDKTAIYYDAKWQDALPGHMTFVRDGRLYINIPAFWRAMRFDLPQDVKRSDIWDMLRVIGFQGEKVTAIVEGKKVGGYYWGGQTEPFEDILERERHGRRESPVMSPED